MKRLTAIIVTVACAAVISLSLFLVPSYGCCGDGGDGGSGGGGGSTSAPSIESGSVFEPFSFLQRVRLAANGLVNPAAASEAIIWYSYNPADVAGVRLRKWGIASEGRDGQLQIVGREESLKVAAALGRGERVDRDYRVLTPDRVSRAVPTAVISWPK